LNSTGNILNRWQITADELTSIVDENPSLRGMMIGYVAERKLTELLASIPDVTESVKYDDHDRTRKGDRVVVYKGERFVIEVKSLQTNTIKQVEGKWIGKAQVDASDRRAVTLDDGSTIETTNLRVGEFDILAVNLFSFEEKWRFVFGRNSDLPRSTHRRYTMAQRENLLATLVTVTWPPEPPFYADIYSVLDGMLRDRRDN